MDLNKTDEIHESEIYDDDAFSYDVENGKYRNKGV